MRKYPCKEQVDERILESAMREIFGNVASEEGLLISFMLLSLTVKAAVTGKKEISVETITAAGKNIEKATQLYNKFLERTTGYSSKERKKMMSK